MDARGYQRYREEAIQTMTPGELLLLLYDELVKRLTLAELELKKENYPSFDAAVERSLAIIHYLEETLDRQYPIGQDLARLYEYLCYELSRVKIGRNDTELTRVKRMAVELRESFQQADKNTSAAAAEAGAAR